MAYNLYQDQNDVVMRLSFLRDNVSASVSKATDGLALIVTLDEQPDRLETVANSDASSTPYNIGTVSQAPSSNAREKPVSPAQIDFASSLLAATRDLSAGKTPVQHTDRNDSRIEYGQVNPLASKSRTTVLESARKWKLDTIVLDAGHGGWDEGAVSRSGLMEKDLSLKIAKMLGARIQQELGIRVVYTRAGDEFVPLAERGHVANQSGGKLFISIHANQADSRMASGTETYFLGTHRGDSARVVMERENEIIRQEENASLYGALNAEELAMRRITQSANLQESEKLASFVEESFELRAGRKSRGVKQAGFYVLFGASMPSILVELGFLSNSKEATYLSSIEGQTALTESIFLAITRFREEYEKGLSITTR